MEREGEGAGKEAGIVPGETRPSLPTHGVLCAHETGFYGAPPPSHRSKRMKVIIALVVAGLCAAALADEPAPAAGTLTERVARLEAQNERLVAILAGYVERNSDRVDAIRDRQDHLLHAADAIHEEACSRWRLHPMNAAGAALQRARKTKVGPRP